MRLKAVGNKVLVKPKELETKTASGIILNYGDAEKRHRAATQQGTVVDIGPQAWWDYQGGPWCKVGDEIIFAQYAGKIVDDPDSNEQFFVIHDEDVQLVVTPKEST